MAASLLLGIRKGQRLELTRSTLLTPPLPTLLILVFNRTKEIRVVGKIGECNWAQFFFFFFCFADLFPAEKINADTSVTTNEQSLK